MAPYIFILGVLLAGCHRWEAYAVPNTPKPSLPSYLRASAPGGTSTVLVEPFVRRDTLFGRSEGDTLAVALSALERLERPRLDGLRTAGTVVGVLAAWIGLAVVGGGLE